MKPYLFKPIFFSLILFSLELCYSQNFKTTIKLDSEELIQIDLIEHNGLPLFGSVFRLDNQKTDESIAERQSRVFNNSELTNKLRRNYRSYFGIVEHKFLYKIYEKLPKDKIIDERTTRAPSQELLSQNHLTQFAPFLLKEKYWGKYFYDPNSDGGYGKRFGLWGGGQKTKQESQLIYQTFIRKNYPSIEKVSGEIWPEDSCKAYVLVEISLGTYNLDKGGYSLGYYSFENMAKAILNSSGNYYLNVSEPISRKFEIDFKQRIQIEYIPENAFEFNLGASSLTNRYLECEEIPFEKLRKNNSRIYGLQKVKMNWLNTSMNGIVTVSVSLDDPKIEFFETNHLKNKLGEIIIQ